MEDELEGFLERQGSGRFSMYGGVMLFLDINHVLSSYIIIDFFRKG